MTLLVGRVELLQGDGSPEAPRLEYAVRWGLGPVFIYECLTNSRRWQTYALRSAGVTALLFAIATIASSGTTAATGTSARAYASLGEEYFFAMIGVELALVMLAAPAATAGAICVDRARGTLAHMLMTDLSDTEIVLGKLAARLLPVLALVACSWPVMAICSLLGGIDPIALTAAFAIIVAVALFGCTFALVVSVWARKTHEVILVTYTVFIAGLLLWPIWMGLSMAGVTGPAPAWALLANPFYLAFAPYAVPGKLGAWDYFGFFALALGGAAVLAALAVWRTRPVACRGSVEKNRGPRLGPIGRLTRRLPGPSLDRNPVLWREWRRSRPSRWMFVVLALLMGTTAVLCIVGAILIWTDGVSISLSGNVWTIAGVYSYMLHVIFGLLLLSAIAPTSMSEERQRGSLDVLAATALSSRAIVIGKWLGTFRLAVLLSLAPGLIALAMATARSMGPFPAGAGTLPDYYKVATRGARIYGVAMVVGTILSHGALITSVGLALAVWIKRQSRAIGVSVTLFILITAAWPIYIAAVASGAGDRGQGLACLSPVVALFQSLIFFMSRRYMFNADILWWGTVWAVEALALALGLLWFTIRTFDRCFDRVTDRSPQIPIRGVVVVILGVMIGVGSLCGAIAAWIVGVLPRALDSMLAIGILLYALAIAVGLVLIAAVAMMSKTASRQGADLAPDRAPTIPAGRFVFVHWWGAFRLVLLLAIGPGILALAQATAHKTIQPVATTKTDPSGVQTVNWELPDPIHANDEAIGELHLRPRLLCAALLITTILVHGAAAVCIGLAVATRTKWHTRALAACIGLGVVLTVGVPLYIASTDPGRGPGAGMWNVVTAVDSLLIALITRDSAGNAETLGAVLRWDAVMALFGAGLFWWTVRAWQRRPLGLSHGNIAVRCDGDKAAPVLETAAVSD